ncbi:MAG TPA: immunoglobulin domain-containing protein, partial [Verrucomicrobiae bacterium]|nr:immunoglobulin domain-containing protein [Verrucomicrobiae bacterium]
MRRAIQIFCLLGVITALCPTHRALMAASPCAQVVAPLAGGAIVQTGERVEGYLLAGNTTIDYFGGGPKDYRNWFVFRLPAFPGPLVGAELRLHAGTIISRSDQETWEMHHVSTPIMNFLQPPRMTNNGVPIIIPSPATYADLGDGAVYGSATIRTNQRAGAYYDPGGPVIVPMSNEALAALTLAQGTNFALGGIVTSQDADTNTPDLVFYNAILGQWPIELVLNFGAAAPTVDLLPRAGNAESPHEFATNLFLGDAMEIVGYLCGQQPMALNWLLNGQSIPGETNPVLYRSFLTPADTGAYQLRVENVTGAVTSAPVNVRAEAMKVYAQPVSRTVTEGDYTGVSFQVSSLLPTIYEWRRNGVLLQGLNTYLLVFYATPADAGQYQAVARNAYGSITSTVATLTVQLRPPTIYQDVPDTVVSAGLSLYLGVGASGHGPITYQWYRNGAPIAGATNFYYTRDVVQFADAGQYYLRMTNVAGQATSRTAQVTVKAFTGVGGPYDISTFWGSTAGFFVAAFGAWPQAFQWYHEGVPIPTGTNSLLQLLNVQPSDAGQYFAIVSNEYGSITSAVARLTVKQGAPVVWANLAGYVATDAGLPHLMAGTPANLSGYVEAGPLAAVQWQHNGVDIPGATNLALNFPRLAPGDTGEYVLVATNIFGRAASLPVVIDVVPVPPSVDVWISEYYDSPLLELPQLAVGSDVTFSASFRGSPPLTFQWRRNGSPLAGQTNETLRLVDLEKSHSGQYTLRVHNEYGTATSAPVSIEVVIEAPYFGLVPGTQEATVGVTSAMRSLAGGSPDILYQWRFEGVNLPGETNSTLFLTPRNVSDSGEYVVVARNAGGEVRATNEVNVRADGALDHWRWALPQPQGSRLYGVAYGNGRYVAVGRAGNALVSTNGTAWKSILLPTDGHVERLTWGNGRFVATGYLYASTDFTAYSGSVPFGFWGIVGASFTSTDGERWTAHPLPEEVFIDLEFGNGTFVGCGSLGRAWVYTSVDGTTWTPQQVQPPYYAYQVVFGSGKFLAATTAGFSQSTNGITWVDTPAPDPIADLSYGNGLFIGTSSLWDGSNSVAIIF